MHRILLPTLLLAAGCQTKADVEGYTGALGTTGAEITDTDGDGFFGDDDCGEGDAAINPGAVELCNGIDDNCDGQIDEGVMDSFWTDADGDGYGDPSSGGEACEPPEGTVPNDTDCNDADGAIHPGAAEVCNGLDDDCSGAADEGLGETWYADLDGDGFGDPDSPTIACEAPSDFVSDASDCDDSLADVHPGAEEVCDERDNDCDEAVDEEVTTTFYVDLDNDGWGGFSGTTEACALPVGYAAQLGDCDDGDEDIHPDAAEICNGVDDDCDTEVDDADASVDLSTGSTFYTDLDGDGFGDPTTGAWACAATSTSVADSTDCDDGNDSVHPGATEVCNSIDDDCDNDIDDDDSSLDTSTATTWYSDTDADTYGDPTTGLLACLATAGQVADGSDCDDTTDAVHPGATEVCNGIDDDCDTDIDDDDSSLDTSTGTTWYADVDGDGEGDPDSTLLTCDMPSGYVGNDTDCDDGDATDTDGDGIQDCADSDRDGDGLDNDLDADPDDDSITRAPTGGTGSDGPLTVSGTELQTDWTVLSSGASTGATTLTVDDASAFISGDEVLVLSQQGSDAGTHQLVYITGISGSTLTIAPALDDSYSSSSVVLVQRVPHYTTVTIPSGSTLAAEDWTGNGGGVVIFRATDTVSIAGDITADGMGFTGGDGVYGNSSQCTQGESIGGLGASATTSANDGGGGCYPKRGDNGDSGAGGGFGSTGSAGTNSGGSSVTSGGSTYGSSALSEWFLGSGGGGGSPDTEGDGTSTSNYAGAGGNGGGMVAIFSSTGITVSGQVSCDGSDGDSGASGGGEVGGGGAGSGGMILLAAPTLTLSGTVSASGGSGGSSAWHSSGPYGSAFGGDGGDGRIRLEYTSMSGSTAPAAGSTGSYSD